MGCYLVLGLMFLIVAVLAVFGALASFGNGSSLLGAVAFLIAVVAACGYVLCDIGYDLRRIEKKRNREKDAS